MDTEEGGRFDFNDGGTYIGNWFQGSAHGLGLATGPNGIGEYSGEWNLGFETCGVYLWPNGNMYAGTWIKGKRHGDGVQVRGKWIYQGEFNAGAFGPYGVKTAINSQAKYEGSWNLNRSEGFGIETCADGSIYAGAWSKGFRHGLGVRKSFITYKTSTLSDDLTNPTTNIETITTTTTTTITTTITASTTTTTTTPSSTTTISTSSTDYIHEIDLNNHTNQLRKNYFTNQSSPKTSDKHHSSTVNLPSKESISVSRKAVIGRAIMRRLKKQHSAIELGRSMINNNSSNNNNNNNNVNQSPHINNDTMTNNTPKMTSPIQMKKPSVFNENLTYLNNEEHHQQSEQQQKKMNPSLNQQNIECINNDNQIEYQIEDNPQLISVIEIYSGEWFQDQRSGYGIVESSNGFMYIGEWIRNQKHGYGIIINPNGTKDEGQFQANHLIHKINRKNKLHLIRQTKLKECVEDALIRAEFASKQAKLIAEEEAKERALKARKAANLAITIIKKALHLSNQARELAFQLEPQFHQPGIEWQKKCHFDMNITNDLNKLKSSTLNSSNSNFNISTDHLSTSSTKLPITQSSSASSLTSTNDMSVMLLRLSENEVDQQRQQQQQDSHDRFQLNQMIKPSTSSLTNVQTLKQHQHHQQDQQQYFQKKRRKFFRKFLSRDSTPNSIDRVDDSPMDIFEHFANLNNPKLNQCMKPTVTLSSSSSPSAPTLTTVTNEPIRPFSAPHKTLMHESLKNNLEKIINKRNSYSPNDRIISPLKEVSNEDVEQKCIIPSEKNIEIFNRQMSSSTGDIIDLCKKSIDPCMNSLINLSSYRQQQQQPLNYSISYTTKSPDLIYETTSDRLSIPNVKKIIPSISLSTHHLPSSSSSSSTTILLSNPIISNKSKPLLTTNQSVINERNNEKTNEHLINIDQLRSHLKQQQHRDDTETKEKGAKSQIGYCESLQAITTTTTIHPPKLSMNSTQDSGYISIDRNDLHSMSPSSSFSSSCIQTNNNRNYHYTYSPVVTTNSSSIILLHKMKFNSNQLTKQNQPIYSLFNNDHNNNKLFSSLPKLKKSKISTNNIGDKQIPFKSSYLTRQKQRRQMILARRKLSRSPKCSSSLQLNNSSDHTGLREKFTSHTNNIHWLPENYEHDDDDDPDDNDDDNGDIPLKQFKVSLKPPRKNIITQQSKKINQQSIDSYQNDDFDRTVPAIERMSEKSEFSSSNIQSTPYHHVINTDMNSNQINRWSMNSVQTTRYLNDHNNKWGEYLDSFGTNQCQIPIVYTTEVRHNDENDAGDDGEDNDNEDLGPVIITPDDDINDNDVNYLYDDDDDITLYHQSIVPSGHHHSLERYTSPLMHRKLPVNNDRYLLKSNRQSFNTHHPNYYYHQQQCQLQNSHQAPNKKMFSSSAPYFIPINHNYQTNDNHSQTMNYEKLTLFNHNIKPSSKQILNEARNPYQINLNKQTMFNNNNNNNNNNRHFQSLSSLSNKSLRLSSPPTPTNTTTPSILLSSMYTNSICPSNQPSISTNRSLCNQTMNALNLKHQSMYNYTTSSLRQQSNKTQPLQQHQQQIQSLHSHHHDQLKTNGNTMKYSTIPLDKTLLLRTKPMIDNEVENYICTNMNNTLVTSTTSTTPSATTNNNSSTEWVHNTLQSNVMSRFYMTKNHLFINEPYRRISWPYSLYEFLPETFSNSNILVTNTTTTNNNTNTNNNELKQTNQKLEISPVTLNSNRNPMDSVFMSTFKTPTNVNENYLPYNNPWFSLTLMNTIILIMVLIISIINWLWYEEKQRKI
ncbi:unnamed protein product [Schistosoma turkestanicum]|nr:unnamed protein product [Schistosoma turkestanicum]